MTPEKFRQWIIILFAATLVSIWVWMGVKYNRLCSYGKQWQKGAMMKQMMYHKPYGMRQPNTMMRQPAAKGSPSQQK